jgi:RimJ/RimL family protein N-acetyltransferase
VPRASARRRPDRRALCGVGASALARRRRAHRGPGAPGYTYAYDWAYDAGEIAERIASGHLYGWVCEVEDGEVVGHFGIHRASADSRIAEAGLVMIDSRFRGRHLGTELGVQMARWAWEAGMLGVVGSATTAHPYSQRPVLNAGGHELCLMLGAIPARVIYEGVEPTGRRIAALITFNRLRDLPQRPIYVPERHTTMLRRIHELNQLGGDFTSDGATEPEGESRFSLYTRPDHDLVASIDVHAAGADLADAVAERLRRLRRAGIDIVHADLPLSHPTTPAACAALEGLGFFFAGVAPVDDAAGFRLRLQHMADVEVVRDDIVVASEFGAELLDYVLEARPDA